MARGLLRSGSRPRRACQETALHIARRLGRARVRGIPRLYFTLSRSLFGSGVQVLDSVTGVKVAGDPHDYFSAMMLFGRYAPEVLGVLDRFVHAGDTVLDVGAQAGYITSHLARRVGPTGQVYSFEPDPKALQVLDLTLRANGFGWVSVLPVAAADREGKVAFFLSETLGWSTAVPDTHLTNLRAIEVQSVRIDDLGASGQIRRPIRFAKIDVEGFECSVLDGMERIIREDRPVLICEINPLLLHASGNSVAGLTGRLLRHGYRLHRLHERSGIFNGGSVDLVPFEADEDIELCDVVCVPAELAL